MIYAISGSTGWLGRASIASLMKLGVSTNEILCFSSRPQTFLVEGVSFRSQTMNLDFDFPQIDLFIHLAFRTRDKTASTPLEQYILENRDITSLAKMFIEKTKPRGIVSISSGAVFESPEYQVLSSSVEKNPYGVLKLEEEKMLWEAGEDLKCAVVINRLWGLSGQDIQNTQPYALAEFIQRAIKNQEIHVRSNHLVWRRYVDARQLMELCVLMAKDGVSLRFNSGGPLVEIEQLAHRVVHVLESHSVVKRVELQGSYNADNYFAKDNKYENLVLTFLKNPSLGLDSQIKNTRLGISR